MQLTQGPRLLLLSLFIGLGADISAQQLSISGTVHDPQGLPSGVSVTLRDPAGAAKQASTDSTGQYRFEGLSAGQYELTFTQPGFETITRTLALANEARTVDVTLSIGGVSTTLEVTDVAGKATASRMEIPNIELPVQVSLISQQVIQQQGVNDLATALRNASGVAAQRFYGIYEYYTIRGFNQSDVLLVDGMRLEGNRINTQLNNVEQVEILKGPSAILYGGSALSGAINIIRKKPQGSRAYDFFYRGGRFNTHQVGGGATGPLLSNRVLYRLDSSFDHADGWRGAGADRFNVSPALTWLISERSRVTVHQAFNRDNFDGDGGLPLAAINLPNFDLSRRFSTPYDFSRIRDSQTNVLFNFNLSSSWEFRNGFFYRWTNDEYLITEGVSYNAADFAIDRYALYFKHHRRPVQNQSDVVGRFNALGMRHTVLAGYEYRDFYNFTDRTPDGGDFSPTSVSLATGRDTQTPFTIDIVERDFSTNRVHGGYWQDQISIGSRLRINVGGRYDDYRRIFHNDFRNTGSGPFTRSPDQQVGQTAYTYRAGLVYQLPVNNQLYFSSSSSFQPVNTIPTNGQPLNPETGRSYEVGHRWQGLNGRLQTSLAFYLLDRNNVVIARGMGRYDQAGQQRSKGVDLDINGDIGHGMRVVANYGYTLPRFDRYFTSNGTVNLSGNLPRYAQRHAANVWLTKNWNSGFTAGAGSRYLGPVFTNITNTVRLGGYTTFTGYAGYRKGIWEWTVNAENLLNRARYFQGSDYDDQVYPGSPINVFTTIRFRFR